MQGYNCIMVYKDEQRKELLFCKRKKDPYKGKFNLVGGKIEPEENGFDAAYRELEEETGITREEICLRHMMDFTYFNQNCTISHQAHIHFSVIGFRQRNALHAASAKTSVSHRDQQQLSIEYAAVLVTDFQIRPFLFYQNNRYR